MDFNLSQDQQFFRETIRSFVDKEIRPVASELEKSGTYPDEIVKKMQEAMQEAFKKKFDQENISQDNFINTDSIIRDAIDTAINNYKKTKSGNKTTAEKKTTSSRHY